MKSVPMDDCRTFSQRERLPISRGAVDPRLTSRSDALFRLAIENMAQGLCMFDAQNRIIVLNPQFLSIYGLPPEIIKLGATARDVVEQSIVAGNYPNLNLEVAWARASERLATQNAWRVRQRLGNGKVIEIAYAPMDGGGWVTTHLDVTERQTAEDRLAYLARHDALTGLANRSNVLDTLAGHLNAGTPVTVFCLDLDRFKSVNDTLGHASGDELLRQVAARLRLCFRENDTVARFGGDEFAIVKLPGGRDLDDSRLARRIIDAISAPFDLGGHHVQIGTSIGIATTPEGSCDPQDVLKHADTALYCAKSDGRGTFRFFEPRMALRLEERRILERDLRDAVAHQEFELHFQPMFDLPTHRLIGLEALLRWNHPIRGPVSPAELIPLAEETGLIVSIGNWVLRTACAAAVGWPDDVGVAVNVSAVQLRGADFVASVRAALDASGLAPRRLTLEITEAVLIIDKAGSAAALSRFHAMGVTLALDDFGTGYSSLSSLRRFPFDRIKVDRGFVQDLTENEDSRAIVRAIIALGRSLGIAVLAEGVETQAQLELLRGFGCQSLQGFLFGRPRPIGELQPGLFRVASPAPDPAAET